MCAIVYVSGGKGPSKGERECKMATLNKAWEILSNLTEWMEQDAEMYGLDAATESETT